MPTWIEIKLNKPLKVLKVETFENGQHVYRLLEITFLEISFKFRLLF